VRYALLCRGSEQREALGKRLRVPADCADHAKLLPVLLDGLPGAMDAPGRLAAIERCDALRKPDRFMALLQAATVAGVPVDLAAWRRWVDAVRGIDAGAIAQACAGDPARIKAALREARLQALLA
jgi:tRNA nucleotidyltransferase (CCA-adding enzyme)